MSARPARYLLLALLLALASACRSTQRVAGPLGSARETPAQRPALDATRALVVRHSDPVLIRRAGSKGTFPLAHYRKRERLESGGWVLTGAGGRAELIWPGVESSLVLFDEGAVVLGDSAHDQPLVSMRSITRARLILTPLDRVELLGGAILRGDESEASGPFVVERFAPSLLRVLNQSKLDGRILFREEVLELRAGDAIHLAIPGDGSAPIALDPDLVALEAGGLDLSLLGELRPSEEPAGVRVRAESQGEAYALGVQVSLNPGEQALFSRLGSPRARSGREPQPAEPEPEQSQPPPDGS
jgi:hypothetical protein